MKQIMLLTLGVIVSSCGPQTKTSSPESWKTPIWSQDANFLQKKKNTCDEQLDSRQDYITVYRQVDGHEELSEFNFAFQVKGFMLRNRSGYPISKTTYNERYQSYINLYYDKQNDEYRPGREFFDVLGQRINQGREFNVCGEVKSYTSSDLENVGLNVSQIITQTYKKIRSVSTADIPSIELSVQPKHEHIKRYNGGKYNKSQVIGHWTNNAFYIPKLKKIAFLPMDKDYKSASFWEIPMVAAHEYGHHIFHTFYQQAKTDTFYGCFPQAYKNTNLNSSRRNIGKDFALRAINEGFADLIAHYTLTNKESSLRGHGCLQNNREVTSPSFGDGSFKKFSSDAIKSIQSSRYDRDDRNCDSPDYQEIHDLGAIVAYQIDKIFNQNLSQRTKKEKLKTLLRFVELLAKNKTQLEQVKEVDYFYFALTLAKKAAISSRTNSNRNKNCQDITNIFDGYQPTRACRFLR